MTQPTETESDLPEVIYVERDPETREKRWHFIKGMGVKYVRAQPDTGVDWRALRREINVPSKDGHKCFLDGWNACIDHIKKITGQQ